MGDDPFAFPDTAAVAEKGDGTGNQPGRGQVKFFSIK